MSDRIQAFRYALLGEIRDFPEYPDDWTPAGFIDPQEVFWGLGPEYTGMKEPTLYRRPEVGESVMVLEVGKKGMTSLIGQGGTIVERPAKYWAQEDVSAAYQPCYVRLEGNDDFEYMFRLGWLLYEDMELDTSSRMGHNSEKDD
jgi:hypothetical protein